jgi:hypothetical protein
MAYQFKKAMFQKSTQLHSCAQPREGAPLSVLQRLPEAERTLFNELLKTGKLTERDLELLINHKGDHSIPPAEMVAFYFKRTRFHIDLVRENLELLTKHPKLTPVAQELRERGELHDLSKFSVAELVPYIWLTERYRCLGQQQPFEYPSGMEAAVTEASSRHIRTNRHHTQFHTNLEAMSRVDLAEMVCDWTAMGQEKRGPSASARAYADQKVGTTYRFSETQRQDIYDFIQFLEERTKAV